MTQVDDARVRGFRARPKDIGIARTRDLARRFGRELRIARVTSGLTQRQLAMRAGVSQAAVAQAEAGNIGQSLEVRCRLAAGAGHEMSLKLFPVSSIPLRDSGQVGIAIAISTAADSSWRCRFESPTGPGAFQAADMVLDRADEVVVIEIERAVVDFQAQWRAAELKRSSLASSESRPVRLVIAVPDTEAMRRRLSENRELIRRVVPIGSRAIWRALRQGIRVGGDGLLRVRARSTQSPSDGHWTRAADN
jgi:transcriptional regulator with XRE-family HTH domain